ncbi:MAG: hypothetical protein MUF03_04190 [Rubrivivax sp.]|jgi:hypothetical protein|nr:hypothetical protein [Rubrivivax sp.]
MLPDRTAPTRRRWLVAAAALPFGLAGIGAATAASVVAGTGTLAPGLADAIAAARDGDVVDVLPGDYRGQTAVVTQKRLTIRGIGRRPVLHGNGRLAEGKALLVVRGGEVTVENLEFRGCRADDRNGAGIRFERGQLTVRRCGFFDNEIGLLTSNDEAARLEIDACEFGEAPRVVGGLHHLLYAGRIASLQVRGSRFHRGFEGHLVKSRARETLLECNLIYDGPEGGASYEVDLPNGGLATLVGNVIGQSPMTQNFALVAFGAEGRPWPESRLVMSHNTLINPRLLPALFLRHFGDRLPPGTRVIAVNNLVVGPGLFAPGSDGEFDGNWPALESMLRDPEGLAFGLPLDSLLRGRGIDPAAAFGMDLAPTAEFAFPVGTRALARPARWSPGAFQT